MYTNSVPFSQQLLWNNFNDPMLKYYRTEYKNDWEYLYLQHLDQVSLKNRLSDVISKFFKLICGLFLRKQINEINSTSAKSSKPAASRQTHALVA
jgi:hypothetical protein